MQTPLSGEGAAMSDKFRRAKVPRHVRIFHRQMQSEAWRHLSGSAVKVLLAMASLEKGDNNGAFFLSARTGAQMTGLGKNAVNRALHELQEKGFVYYSEPGGFSRKTPHAASWGLTWQAGPHGSKHRAPSHAYEKWRPANFRGPRNRDSAVPEIGTVRLKPAPHCPENGDSETDETAENRQSATVPKTGTHTSNQSQRAAEPGNGSLKEPENDGGPKTALAGWWQLDCSQAAARLGYSAILAERLSDELNARKLAA
jgi:hypothetical protein